MITLDNVSFARGKQPVISGINATFPAGEVHAVLGANGAGKSTLLKLLAGELRPQSGNIRIDGTSIGAYSPAVLARIRAVLPQTPSLNFSLMVRDIVGMGTYPFQTLTGQEIGQLIAHGLQLVDIEHLAGRPYMTLSGGEQQRVQLARTLVQILAPAKAHDKRFLLLDEPTANLDPRHQHHVLQMAKNLALERRIGVIIVLHDINLAVQYTDRLLLLANGECIAHGPAWEVLTENNLEKIYQLRPTIVPHPLSAKRPLVLFG